MLTARPARVLLIGDSILDQEGSAAAFLLRQAGVDARAISLWGSGLIGLDSYDYGKTKLSGYWFRRAKREMAAFDPDAIGVYMNHSYFPPYPHDAAGNRITDLRSAAGQRMIGQQANAFVTILRGGHAKVFFIAPVPVKTVGDPDPSASNPIWRGYVPVLRALHVMIARTAGPIESPNGLRAETEVSCRGTQQRVRPAGDVHLTRFGAGLAGTALAAFVANLEAVRLRGNAAPGDAVAALVPTDDARGYWLVGCDGSIFHFGDARPLAGARAAIRGHGGVVAAVAAPSGRGLWLVAADGTIAAVGDAQPVAFARPPAGPTVAATTIPGGHGLWAVTAAGALSTAPLGSARAVDERASAVGSTAGKLVGIAATPDGVGYWLATSDGTVFAFGDARVYRAASRSTVRAPIVGLAPTSDGRGYWLVDGNGDVFAYGDARFDGSGTWQRPAGRRGSDVAAPGPTIGIVSARANARGYWIFGTTGRVVGRGGAGYYGGSNNLALETQ